MFYQNNFSSSISNGEINYWQKQLENIPPLLDFPTDRVRSLLVDSEAQIDYPSANIGENLFTFSEDLRQGLQEIAQQETISISIILLSAFQVLLYRYTNQEDIVVGCLNWYDNRQKTEPGILPIRVTLEGNQKFNELLKIVQSQISETSDYVSQPIPTSTTASEAQNSEFRLASLSQMLFRFDSLSSTSEVKSNKKIPEPELFLNIREKSQHLICRIEYDRNLFDATTIQRIFDNYQVLLKSIIANPQSSIASMPLLSSSEQQQVLVNWNQTQAESARQCIHQLFETRVRQNPEAVAIICRGEQLTYGELNAQANQLARYLQTLGVTRDSLVGLCLERSLSMVVGVLAILKAGGAYIPLDISNPPARLAFILEDARVKVLLTQESLLKKLPTQIEQTICLERDWHLITRQPQDNLDETVKSSDLAHIVYTSGSTGKPKGVMLTHGNLSHYAQSLQLALEITPADIYLHRGSIALIVSARQLLMPLAQGATAVIVTAEESRNPLELFELIKRHGVTIVDHVPSFWRNFSAILERQNSDYRKNLLDNQVRLVAAGGEQVTPEIYQCWRETFKPDVKLANIYGQTEGTGVVTIYQIPAQIDRRFKTLPVGRPIPNMRIYLLNSYLQPVPIGVAAEIHISGAGVAQGYLNRLELTAEKFVDNPYVRGERLYKTGDLGRYLPDGSIQFLGRIDRQVNIQGLRIELGEIEAVLSQHQLVQETAVIIRENRLGETLCAYVVPNKIEQPTVEILRSYLQEKLPTYMIPGTFIFLDAFPLTISGKVDYRALSELNVSESLESAIAPRDCLESELVQMLQEILMLKAIGIRDDFIELGGNSLLAARVVTEIEHRYRQKIPVSAVFQASTPEALANLIRRNESIGYPKSFVTIKQGNSRPILFCIHNLGHGLEFYRPLAKYLNTDISLYGLSSFLSDEPYKPHPRNIMGLASYYTPNLQQVQPQGPYYLIGVSFGGVVAYEIAQRLVAQGQEVKFLGLLDTFYPDKNSIRKPLSLKERISGHIDKVRTKGTNHVLDRVKWRFELGMNTFRSHLYQIDWVRENFIDTTSRNFAQVEHIQYTREYQAVNQNYVIQPYPGHINMFRATDDMDSKLDWQELAQSGLSIFDVPGEHLEILQEPYVSILARKIQLALRESTQKR
ncbi:non-ribosomal peptide synthetase [Pleurocapsa sp. CCALA 161]|uniref:non-ribosomal peptide synthetase n=1 Tax=Pleurocapsa sp. CCALA 161 TaxID=2107688 RepID=UPI000D064DC9|nr:amino acid adenylation domain-containing protein [Pleurocapsa sp. CCALA 161]PSB09960.1 non-ribosomal peptide synthetase [Pleurocapsa sp. CCALA 161]